MLIVSNRQNGGYNGKHKAKAAELVKGGTRIGMCHVSGEEANFFCHICKKDQPLPFKFSKESKIDELLPCPGCKTPFVFAEV